LIWVCAGWDRQSSGRNARPTCWTVTNIVLPTKRRLPADRAGGPTKKYADASLTVASLMLGENHATFLTVEVLTSSVHRNILSPAD
jgi:hypothetical protein